MRPLSAAPLCACARFQSTHPLRGATISLPLFGTMMRISIHAPLAGCDLCMPAEYIGLCTISIHAPLAGCDQYSAPSTSSMRHFNPRTPCGVRLPPRGGGERRKKFQSTHPLRGATDCGARMDDNESISIHAPLAGCDYPPEGAASAEKNFNPRTPCGVRRIAARGWTITKVFQSTHPLRGATGSRRRPK